MSIIHFLNLASVGVFGIALSAAFCEIAWTRKKILAMIGSAAGILLFQGIIYFMVDSGITEKLYPLITHLPLTVALCIFNRACLWPGISVLIAYLCCQLRRWLALLVVAVFSGGSLMQDITELAVTAPILLILMRYIAPLVRFASHYPVSLQCRLGLIPAVYYAFDYLTRIYTDLLLEGGLVVVEFMPFVCSIAYLFFAAYAFEEQRAHAQLEQMQAILNLQMDQAVREITALRESEEATRIYRHDMRHHMQYLSSCMENGQLNQAQEYIQKIYSEIEAGKVTIFCENEAANLIFSAFSRRARDSGILMQISARIPQAIPVSEPDLCVLLANALENALHACKGQGKKGRAGVIEVTVYEKDRKLLLQIINTCGEDVIFDNEIPVTNRAGHGIGVQSICAIVEQYGGIYTFSAGDGKFILRISI